VADVVVYLLELAEFAPIATPLREQPSIEDNTNDGKSEITSALSFTVLNSSAVLKSEA